MTINLCSVIASAERSTSFKFMISHFSLGFTSLNSFFSFHLDSSFFITNFICFLFLSCSSSLSSLWVLQHWKCVSYLTLLPHIRYKHQYNLYLTNLFLILGTESIYLNVWILFESCSNWQTLGSLTSPILTCEICWWISCREEYYH